LIELFQPTELSMPRTVQHNKIADAVVIDAAPTDNALRAIRMAKGYSVEHLALTCGLAIDEIMDIESGKDADPVKLRRIAHALQLPEDALIAPAMTPAAEDRSAA
jgi:DNA-binding XRE family transcriptional regulator